MMNLKIDGKDVQIAAGATILEAAEQIGVKIPTLCYLKKVSPTGACRICAVEVAGADKTMTACNTRAVDGMVVTTKSEKLTKIRRQIIELLLVNHPLDCPVCDAGGECDLQDICYSHDVTTQPFEAEDVNAETIDKWPLIQQVPNRCVMCEKCVKVCHETIGSSALFINDKGDRAFIDKTLEKCEFCGNCVQVCPTGTMISKPFKFKARPWELRKTASICSLCSAQCQVDLHSKQGKVLRVTADDETTVNHGNLCFGGFFGHDYLNSPQRLTTPLIDQQAATWETALSKASMELARIRDENGGKALAGLSSPRLSNEENYLFQKLFRVALNSNNIDSELRFGLLRSAKVLRDRLALTGGSNPLNRIGQANAIVVFGCDPTAESPAVDWQIQLGHRKHDAKLVVANPRKIKLSKQSETFLQYTPGSEAHVAEALAKLIVDRGHADDNYLNQFVGNAAELKDHLQSIDIDKACDTAGIERALLEEAADHIGSAASVAVVFGRGLTGASSVDAATSGLIDLALVSGALHGDRGGLFPVEEKGNAFGLLDAGVAPDLLPGQQDYSAAKDRFAQAWHTSLPETGADAKGILDLIEAGQIKALYLAGADPLTGYPESARWKKALAKLELLIVQGIFSNQLTELAHIVLPGAATAEKRGSLTSMDGRVSTIRRVVDPPGQARPDLAIIAELFAGLTGVPAPSETAIQKELYELSGIHSDVCQSLAERKSCRKQAFAPTAKSLKAGIPVLQEPETAELKLLIGKSLFQFGTTTTYGLASNELEDHGTIAINPVDAERLNVANPGAQLRLTGPAGSATAGVKVTDQVPAGLLFAAYNFTQLNILQLTTGDSNCVAVTAAKA